MIYTYKKNIKVLSTDRPASYDLLHYDYHKKKAIFIELKARDHFLFDEDDGKSKKEDLNKKIKDSLREFVKKISCSQDYRKTYFIAFSKIPHVPKEDIDTEYLKRYIRGEIRAELGGSAREKRCI